MNTPVFAEPEGFGKELGDVRGDDFVYGTLPGSMIRVGGPLSDVVGYHTAILGVTGSGKTELAYDIVRHAVTHDVKVVCIDLTARYEGRLEDLHPRNLSISADLARELSQKLTDVETGEYGAGKEKKALNLFADRLRTDVAATVREFLTSDDEAGRVGIVTLEEISNTKATLHITELFLTSILHFARDEPDQCPSVLVVVEEAHTVMPEPSTMGLGDYESRALVGKIAQIALQGRKYGVGLLVVAQRTATVSKTVLTQCNTIIALSCFDDTSIGFLENVFGKGHAHVLPDLPFLQAVVFGKGVRSERPLIVRIPFVEAKAALGD